MPTQPMKPPFGRDEPSRIVKLVDPNCAPVEKPGKEKVNRTPCPIESARAEGKVFIGTADW